MSTIFKNYPVSTTEFDILHEKYGRLCHSISWDLIKRNGKNNHTDEQEDINQEILISLMHAASYYKRQTYIKESLMLCEEYSKDKKFLAIMISELKDLWSNRKRHGAGKQKFGEYQEKLLDKLVKLLVPKTKRPAKDAPLKVDSSDFGPYCKSIAWNRQRCLGKKITREKSIRASAVSLSQYDYLGGK
jgi:hypothetical protein